MTTSTDQINEIGFYRLYQILGDPKRGIPGIIPISRSVWYDGIATGRFPKPIPHIDGERAALWKKSDIHALVKALESRS